MRNVLIFFLAAALCLGLFAACGADGSDTSVPASQGDTQSVSDADSDTASSNGPRTVDDVLSASRHYVGMTDQKNRRIVVFDLSVKDWSKKTAVVWSFSDPTCRTAAGIKFRHSDLFGGDVVLYCGPAGGTIVSYRTKKILFHTDDIPHNPHSVELLPDGTFLVAGTQGKAVYAYNPLSGSTKHTAILEIPEGHGILWDPKYDMLWTAGAHNIDSYTVTGGPEKPVFTPAYQYSRLPGGIHDLAPVYGDTDKLWFTCEKGILQLDKKTGAAISDYFGNAVTKGLDYVPGVGNFPDGTLVWVTPTGKTDYWTTDILHCFADQGAGKLRLVRYQNTNDAYYKCRVWITDYQ